MRVLHFIYDDPGNPWVAGGGAIRAREIYRRLADRVTARVITGNYPGAGAGTFEGVEYARVGARRPYPWSRLTYAARANWLLRRADYDVAVFDYSAYTPVFLPRRRPVGMAVHHVTGPTARARWGRLAGGVVAAVEGAMLRRARWVSLSARVVEAEVRALTGPGTRFELVGAGVGEEFFRVPRREAGYLLYFGRMDTFQKGLDTLIAAMAILRRNRPEVRLKMAGRGKDGAAVVRLAREAGVQDAVELLGAVSDDQRLSLLSGATLMLMPSRFEGFGLAAAEAMAAGVPLVASDAGSLPEVVDPPAGGVLVPRDDPAALARAVDALLADRERRERLSDTARVSARRFTWDAVADRHHRFLELIAGAGEIGP